MSYKRKILLMGVDVLVIYLSIVIAFSARFDSQMLIEEISRYSKATIDGKIKATIDRTTKVLKRIT